MENKSGNSLDAAPTPDDVQALLGAANNASEKVSLIHLGFMAACAYNSVIVFSTTDMDLLVGKGVKLPLIDVEVPIVGFYVLAPYIVVLMHFNLLLQLQMLSRKLYAYDTAANRPVTRTVKKEATKTRAMGSSAPRHSGNWVRNGGLHIFPYSFYLVGGAANWMHRCLGTVVGITVLLLPLFTLLALQLRFLAYQESWYTWLQRTAVLADIVLVFYLWPIIMCREGTGKGYWKRLIGEKWYCKVVAGICALLWIGWCAGLFLSNTTVNNSLVEFFHHKPWLGKLIYNNISKDPDVVPLIFRFLFLVVIFACLNFFFRLRKRFCNCNELEGMLPYLLVLAIGIPMMFALMVKGERLETLLGETNFSESVGVKSFRILDLTGQIIFAKGVPPDIVAKLRAGGTYTQEGLTQVVPVDLKKRGLRGAKLTNAMLTGADLAMADLTEAKLYGAHLEYVILDEADLSKADATEVHLEGANLSNAILAAACFRQADLQGAFLTDSRAASADFDSAELKGADLHMSLRKEEKLQDLNKPKRSLERVNFLRAGLEGANLSHTNLSGANFKDAKFGVTDVTREAGFEKDKAYGDSACQNQQEKIQKNFTLIPRDETDSKHKPNLTENIEQAFRKNCCADDDAIIIYDGHKIMDAERERVFNVRFYDKLRQYACESPAIARALLLQGDEETSRRFGFVKWLKANLKDAPCHVMHLLTPEDQRKLRLRWKEVSNDVPSMAKRP
jgi:uncharacterized protein YjbI with pentapeptide repeats